MPAAWESSARRFAAAVSTFGLVAAVAIGCGTQPPGPAPHTPPPAAATPSEGATAPPAIAGLIDPRWMGFDTSQPWRWLDVERWITPDFQLFGFRPVGETETPHPCQGCGVNPPTAEVKVYAPGTFDPAEARGGQPVEVDGRGGYFRAYDDERPPAADGDGFRDAVLTWEYADDAWATARGLTSITSELDRLLELARALRPDDRTPAVAPLRLANVPARLPLAAIHASELPIYSRSSDYGTTLTFGPCISLVKARACHDATDRTGFLSVQILHRDDYTDGTHRNEVARTIGGEDGRYDQALGWAAVLLQPGRYVQFDLSPPRDSAPDDELAEVLNSVEWAPDLADEATWPAVGEWAK